MTIRVEVVAHSLNVATGNELLTMEWEYPRMVHAEALRHRSLSRNAASSRAIPVRKMLDAIRENPARPVEWGTARAGMQAGPPLDGKDAEDVDQWWESLRVHVAAASQRGVERFGLHKQVVNRPLEPFAHITELVSGTEWGNFYRLRISPYADPTLRAVATAAARAHLASTPRPCEPGDWHIPFGDQMPEGLTLEERLKVATARCARISYLNHDGGRFTPEQDIAKHDELRANEHWSPFEHCAYAMRFSERNRNFRGWRQYRDIVDRSSHEPMTRDQLAALVEEHGYPGY